MDGTFPSPAVKDKYMLVNRLKGGVGVLRRKSGGPWGEGAVLNAWSDRHH